MVMIFFTVTAPFFLSSRKNSPRMIMIDQVFFLLFSISRVDVYFLSFLSFTKRTNNASLAITPLPIVKYCVFVHYGSTRTNEKMAMMKRYQPRAT